MSRPITNPVLRMLSIAAAILWAGAVLAGMQHLWQYKNTPGRTEATPSVWPGSNPIAPRDEDATLIMFVHPRCVCSKASLEELNLLMQRTEGRVSAWVLLAQLQGTPEKAELTPTWHAAQRIPNVKVLTDIQGAEAARFGAATSGHVVLYDANQQLIFSGGITGSRGHVGDNAGLQSVLNLLNNGVATSHEHKVFGCGIHEPHSPTA